MCAMWSSAQRGRIIRELMRELYPSKFVEDSLGVALMMLRSDGEFWPYAVTTGSNGKTGAIIGKEYESRVGSEITEELQGLVGCLREKAASNEIIEAAIVTNRSRNVVGRVIDSICVDIETKAGFSAFVIFEYQL